MESGNYNTSLMFDMQWDLVLKHLETKGVEKVDLKKDSTSWGNYKNNAWNITNENLKYAINGKNWTNETEKEKDSSTKVLLSTGEIDKFCKQGIYDLAGNVWEYTLGYSSYSTEYRCIVRGGAYSQDGSFTQAFFRNFAKTSATYADNGFRVTLY